MATATEPTVLNRDEKDDDLRPAADDEDTGAQVAPIVQLTEVAVTTGEENEDVLLELKSKLYRFDKEGNQWKERGVGIVKLLKHKETEKVRLVMRQNKTLKICANHHVGPTMSVQEHQGNDKSCVWHAADFSDGELKDETFCIRFATIENCQTFKDMIAQIAAGWANDNGDGEANEKGVGQANENGEVEANKNGGQANNNEGRANDNGEGRANNNGETEEGNTAASLIERLSVETEAGPLSSGAAA